MMYIRIQKYRVVMYGVNNVLNGLHYAFEPHIGNVCLPASAEYKNYKLTFLGKNLKI